jgi:hypothetical protein
VSFFTAGLSARTVRPSGVGRPAAREEIFA